MTSQSCKTSINLLHLSDLHIGLTQQGWAWPTLKTAFFSDLERLHELSGPWDIVIFSGDLTQSGSKKEFDQLSQTLKDLWAKLKTLGSIPKLFVIPGNHDLERPPQLDPVAKVLSSWWNQSDVQDAFWKDQTSAYRTKIEECFHQFQEWREKLKIDTEIEILGDIHGTLPGDVSAVFTKNDNRLGIVGLNSSWLQLNSANWNGKLCIHPQQLIELTNGEPDQWCQANTFNIVVTHHPASWLHSESLKLWKSEINTHRRFDAHFFGHMHEGIATSISIAGSRPQHEIQAPSLFGLEKFGSDEVRTHGYSTISLNKTTSGRTLQIWPRKAITTKTETRKLVADNEWDLPDGNSCHIELGNEERGHSKQHAKSVVDIPTSAAHRSSSGVLQSISRSNSFSESVVNIRRTEQDYAIAALTQGRAIWLASDWGLGGGEFLNQILFRKLGQQTKIFHLDASLYRSKTELLNGVPEQIGCSFEELCKNLDEISPCALILDDIHLDQDTSTYEDDLQSLIQTVLEFGEQIHVVAHSRKGPACVAITTVELKPLDEADTAAYIRTHRHGGAHLLSNGVASKIYRHSGGIPNRIDSILRDLEIVGIDGLQDLDIDFGSDSAIAATDTPPALAAAIRDLAQSSDEGLRRAHDLLKVLSIFPQGELLNRVKRFHGPIPFWPPQAHALAERALIDATPIPSLRGEPAAQSGGKALVVRRLVREYMAHAVSAGERRTLNDRALTLYFVAPAKPLTPA